MKVYNVDANLILRFLTGSPEEHAKLAAEFFQQGERGKFEVKISPVVVAEVVFVLAGRIYGCSREDIVNELTQFLSNPAFKVVEFETLIKALELFKVHKIDFADAYLAADALVSGASVASFDKDFTKIKEVDLMLLSRKL